MRHSTGQRTIRTMVADQLLGRTDLVRQGGDPRRAGDQLGGRRRGRHASSPAAGTGHRRHGAATPGAVRPATVLELAAEATGHERTRRGSAESRCSPRVSSSTGGQRSATPSSTSTPTMASRATSPGVGMLRRAVADGGRYPTVRSARGAQRHNARRRDSRRHRRRRRPTDLPCGDHHRLRRPRRRRRRRTGRRQDVRRRRLPGRPRRPIVRARATPRSTPGSAFRRRDSHRPPRTVRPARRRDPSPARRLLELDRSDGHRCVPVHGRRRQMGAARRQRADRSRRRPRARRRDPNEQHADVVTGSCVLTNIAIEEQTGRAVIHPFELLAAPPIGGRPDEDRDG